MALGLGCGEERDEKSGPSGVIDLSPRFVCLNFIVQTPPVLTCALLCAGRLWGLVLLVSQAPDGPLTCNQGMSVDRGVLWILGPAMRRSGLGLGVQV